MPQDERQIWDLWMPGAGAQGLPFARGRCDKTEFMLVHAAPLSLSVDVWNDQGTLLVRGRNLERSAARTPITRLQLQGGQVTREEIWPIEADYGLPVILPGGEIGILRAWWNAPDHQEWRWSVEFYNHQ
ncbi:hypothetical protein [Ktedonobacter robiniae]|uniref:DUF7712 domain-containing protein n=1 Tax=Ktedonobacter robiniae TaxID=2778365 RepID=A0ABQ3UGV3_9CHLR|nr:hypothetical protein [Ktedonobacter robiniae]GHO51936.1 hypothetical protein KSB_04110 [Ktedonobacter robiniae]